MTTAVDGQGLSTFKSQPCIYDNILSQRVFTATIERSLQLSKITDNAVPLSCLYLRRQQCGDQTGRTQNTQQSFLHTISPRSFPEVFQSHNDPNISIVLYHAFCSLHPTCPELYGLSSPR